MQELLFTIQILSIINQINTRKMILNMITTEISNRKLPNIYSNPCVQDCLTRLSASTATAASATGSRRMTLGSSMPGKKNTSFCSKALIVRHLYIQVCSIILVLKVSYCKKKQEHFEKCLCSVVIFCWQFCLQSFNKNYST